MKFNVLILLIILVIIALLFLLSKCTPTAPIGQYDFDRFILADSLRGDTLFFHNKPVLIIGDTTN